MQITRQDALDELGIAPANAMDDRWLDRCVNAANAYLLRVRPDLPPDFNDASVELGLIKLCTRWYRRRNGEEMAGFEQFGFIPASIDKDIEVLLGIGRAAGPVIA
ncbi:MAG: hypothetical protein WCI74_10560 [Actinomycetes bacterium]